MRTPLKILLLEDNPLDAEIIQRLLAKEVAMSAFRLVMNKADFLDALDHFEPDVILSDNSLPRYNASEALKVVSERNLSIPFILITGTVSEEYAADITKKGADDYILKDRLTRLPVAIETALRFRQAEKEKLLIEQQRAFDHNNLKALINTTQDLLWSVGRDMKLITFNEAFNVAVIRMTGKGLEKGSDILSSQFTPGQRERYQLLYERAFTGEVFTIVDHFTSPVNEAWHEISFYPIRHEEEIIGTACFSRDITQRKKAEATVLRLEQEKLQEQERISRAIVTAQENERDAIGKELHDNVNQILVATNMALSMAKSGHRNVQEVLMVAMQYLKEAIHENRKISHLLVAPNLEDEKLARQFEKLFSDMFDPASIEVFLRTEQFDESVLDADRKLNIYRIVQEQCSNISKYAQATSVEFILTSIDGIFKMVIADNGKGMASTTPFKGIGIRNIKARLSLFGGKVTIHSAPDQGFRMVIEMPL